MLMPWELCNSGHRNFEINISSVIRRVIKSVLALYIVFFTAGNAYHTNSGNVWGKKKVVSFFGGR